MNKFTKGCLIVCLVFICASAICMGAGIAMGGSLKEVQRMADEGEFNIGGWNIGKHRFYYGPDEDDTAREAVGGESAGGEAAGGVTAGGEAIGDGTTGGEAVEGEGAGGEVAGGKIFTGTFQADEVESLKVDLKYGEVFFTDSDSGMIEVYVDAPERNTYQCVNKEGTLELEDHTSKRAIGLNGLTNSEVTVTIAIPAGKAFEEVEISSNAGVIALEHEFLAEKMDLELDAGELTGGKLTALDEFSVEVGAGMVKIDDFSTEKLEADCGVGEIDISGTVSQKAEADCGVGQITLNLYGKETDYNYELKVNLGEININGTSYSSLSSNKKINNYANKKISLDCGVGQIDVTVKE